MRRLRYKILTLTLAGASFLNPVFSASIASTPASVDSSSLPNEEVVKNALKEFESLSNKERKSRIKDVKKTMKEYRADKKAGKASDTDTLLLAILAILLPPLAVYLKENAITSKFWISLLLCFLFWIPAVIFALLVVFDAI